MTSRHNPIGHLIVAAIAAFGVIFAAGQAAAQAPFLIVLYVPANTAPPVPSGLKVTCLANPQTTQSSNTCPIVKYQGITTWAYSYYDNRNSLALVSYDEHNKVVRSVERPGTRYVFEAISSLPDQTVMFVGQALQSTTVPWSALGGK